MKENAVENTDKKRKIVISGPTGAIGHALIEECLKQNAEILLIGRRGSERMHELCKQYSGSDSAEHKENIKILYLDLNEYNNYVNYNNDKNSNILVEFGNTYDIFYYLAWMGTTGDDRNNKELQEQNIVYALAAVRLAKALGCHTFVGAGSQAEYGRKEGLLSADTDTDPETEYGRAKLEAGIRTRELCRELGIKHIWPRILSIYGPYDTERSMIMQAVRCMRAGETAEFTKGEQQWDYLYSADAAKALFLLGQKGVDGCVYPIGSGKTKRLSEYISIIHNLVNPDSEIRLGAIPYGEKQVMYLCADISRLKKDTGFEPQTEFEEGIRGILKWLDG